MLKRKNVTPSCHDEKKRVVEYLTLCQGRRALLLPVMMKIKKRTIPTMMKRKKRTITSHNK
jgi:hypothetical protein